jgi:uncharacterized protein (TIGR03437 family)
MRVWTAIAVVGSCAAALADTLVVPNNLANTPGNMGLKLGSGATHIQEIVGSGQFTVPITVTALRLRSAIGAGPAASSSTSVKVILSTTQAYPNTNNGHALPSLTFANNLGPDAKVVYNAPLTFASPGCNGPAPCPFDLVVPFSTPFSYDPNNGRLLVDVVASAAMSNAGSLDAVQFSDTNSSTVVVLTGDPSQAIGTLTIGGLVLGLDHLTTSTGPIVSRVLNSALNSAALAPGALASISGTNFAASNISVNVGGKAAYVIPNSASATQVNVQLPTDAPVGATTLTVTAGGVTSTAFNVTLATYAPAFLTQSGDGTGPARVLTAASALVTSGLPGKPGDTLTAVATGLGPTNPPTPTGPATAANPLATTPTLTVGGVTAKVLSAGAIVGLAGAVQINFTVPPGVQGTLPLVVSIGGASSSTSATLPVAGLTSILNNASFSPALAGTAAPGSFVTVYVNGLASTDQLTGFPATKFQGVQMTFNGIPAPLFHLIGSASPQQIDLLVPNELPTTGNVNVQLSTSAAQYPNYALKMAPFNPGLYRIADPVIKTRFNVIAQFANTVWLALPVSLTAALNAPACTSSTNVLSLCGRPAAIGDYLVIYTTGLGLTTPNGDPNGKPLPTGVAPPADGSVLYETPALPAVTIGGIATKVLYSGLAPGFPGLYQVDVQVPTGVANGDDIPVVLTMGGVSDTATISIQPRP